MTMLAAALATQPRIVFLDEPLAGLNAEETERLLELILRLHERTDLTFVVVEHKIRALSRLSDRLMVLHFGRCICLDTPANVVRDATVIEVYLGSAFVA
jgi:branched-chain amino acid transport system ATP-binding protein